MISRLKGTLVDKQPPLLFIEIADALTYEIQASMHTFYQLPEAGQAITLHTQLIVREDGHYLYGFIENQERVLFNQLIKVNGIGPKVALAILSAMTVSEFSMAIKKRDLEGLQRIPGIGKKTAERLVIDMRDRLTYFIKQTTGTTTHPTPCFPTIQHDAIEALIGLGYKPQEANRAVLSIKNEDVSLETLIRMALKNKG